MYLAKKKRKAADGETYPYWTLQEKYWDKGERRSKERYLAAVGHSPTITESEAHELAKRVSEKLGEAVTVDDLREVRRLEIVPDGAD